MNVEDDTQNIVTEFISYMDNDHQSEIILKLFCNYFGRLYLIDYKYDDIEDVIHIDVLGSKTLRGREFYHVTIKNNKFSCTCKDFIYRSNKYNIVCKHITFIVCKVGYILDYEFFKTKILSEYQYNRIKSTLDNNIIWRNRSISLRGINDEFDIKDDQIFNSNDICPICYDAFGEISLNVSCPKCKNYIHKHCMDTWLEINSTCIYCRSYEWLNYIDLKKI
jgi:hypothetical protein